MIQETRPKFSRARTFQNDLQTRVEQRLAALGRSRHGGLRIYCKTALLLLWAGFSYVGLVAWAGQWWEAIPLAISLGLSLAAIGFNVSHDGNHGAYSSSKAVNRGVGALFDLLGASSYFWRWKHNVFHHSYPNVEGLDDDIDLGVLCRMSPHQPYLKHQRFQHLYMWALYGLIIPKWQFYDDFVSIIRGKIGENSIPRPRGGELALFVGGKLASFAAIFVVPVLFHALPVVLLGYLFVVAVEGITLSVVFQLAHSVEETSAFSADETGELASREWAIHQAETTANFARGNRLLTWFVGGLNHQIEHHLFPRISHVHLPHIAEVVQQVCREHGVRYQEHRTFRSAIASHYGWLRLMGRPPAQVSAEAS
jgi:linoleoyl-CoA desaturase